MKILCNHCKHFFDIDPDKAGRVQYSKSKDQFRVELILNSPCPTCKTSLKVISNQKKQSADRYAVGYPIEKTSSKKIEKPYELSANSETVFNPAPIQPKKSKPIPVIKPTAQHVSRDENNVETRMTIKPSEAETRVAIKKETAKVASKAPVTLEDRVKEKLKTRLDSYHRISIQSYKLPSSTPSKKKFFIPNLSKIAKHASEPKVYLSVLTLSAVFMIYGIMASVFHATSDSTKVASKETPALEEGMEEFEPLHHDDSMGGPSFPSDNRKAGLEDETIKKIASNLQILHLPPLRQVTSTYGVRLDPFTKKLAFHAGVDFKADMGTKIEAAMDGTVKFVGKKSMYGNAVVLKHDNGYETLYGHLSKILVKQGQKITQKDIIGLAGSSGRSTGPHLHFELIKNGKKIDPLSTDLLTAKKK